MSNDKQLKAFDNWLDDLLYELSDEVAEAVIDATTKTLRQARELAPVDTGYLRRNIQMEIEQNGNSSITGTVYSNSEYSLFVEFGTYKMNAQPFLFPSYFKYVNEFENTLKKILSKLQ